MAKGDDIEERLIDFAVRIIRVCDVLSDKPAERRINVINSAGLSAPAFKLPSSHDPINHSTIHQFTN
jgi:hypothetical protein